MSILTRIAKSRWRTAAPIGLLLLLVYGTYLLWSPGLKVIDGRNDRGQNGIWLSHRWLGDNEWFERNNREHLVTHYRDPNSIQDLADHLRRHNITDVFPHLCPASEEGDLPGVDAEQVERFLGILQGFRVLPWVGGPNGANVRLGDSRWRQAFTDAIANLLERHPRFAGVHLNIEPLPSGNPDFLQLLVELRAALPEDRILSVAAYPPPTRWHPFPEVHWDEAYYRNVTARCDQIAVMMYDTAIRYRKVYQHVMAAWTTELLAWSGSASVLFGLPTYSDQGVGYHFPAVENLTNALLGVHRGLARVEDAGTYQGVALYCNWETDQSEWELFDQWFMRR